MTIFSPVDFLLVRYGMLPERILTSAVDAAGPTLWVFLEAISVCLSPAPYRAKGWRFSFSGSLVAWGLTLDRVYLCEERRLLFGVFRICVSVSGMRAGELSLALSSSPSWWLCSLTPVTSSVDERIARNLIFWKVF